MALAQDTWYLRYMMADEMEEELCLRPILEFGENNFQRMYVLSTPLHFPSLVLQTSKGASANKFIKEEKLCKHYKRACARHSNKYALQVLLFIVPRAHNSCTD
eukprot:13482665-Ditylum_brightwellii.AAC.1